MKVPATLAISATGMEKNIEKYLKKKVEKIGGLCLKWIGTKDCPDRIILYKKQVWLVETKSPGKQPRLSQKAFHRLLKSQTGHEVRIIDTKEKVLNFIDEIRTT